jgi:hypothetical protein
VIELEFTEIDEEVKDFAPSRRDRYWRRVSEWAQEGRRSAAALLQYGHQNLRVVVDSEWELAITCDDCNLWASMTRELAMMKMSYASAGGTLLKVVDCSPTAVRDHFKGQVTQTDAWTDYSGWQLDFPDITSRDGEYLYHTHRKHRKGGYQYKKEREARDAAAAEEQGS